MRTYSPFFHTLHDEAGPVGSLGRGTHYSILRAVIWPNGEPKFHDFAVIWDEDHDDRIIWIIEKLFVKRMLQPVLAIGERKASVTMLVAEPYPLQPEFGDICQSIPSDIFNGYVEDFSDPSAMIINDKPDRVAAYISGIHALWMLGTKPCTSALDAYRVKEDDKGPW